VAQLSGILVRPAAELDEPAGKCQCVGPVLSPGDLAGPLDGHDVAAQRQEQRRRPHQAVRPDVTREDLIQRGDNGHGIAA